MKLIFNESIQNLKDLNSIVEKIKPYFKSGSLILLKGDLGAGKTTLTTSLIQSFGYDLATSPTYALHHSYPIELQGSPIQVEHLDLYRLQNEEEIEASGLWDLFQNSENIILVEWAERVDIDQWPIDWKRYQIQITQSETSRSYKFYSF